MKRKSMNANISALREFTLGNTRSFISFPLLFLIEQPSSMLLLRQFSEANQMRAFLFKTLDGKRKAPDLVVFKDGLLAIFEAKIRPRNLFAIPTKGLSDFQAMSQAATSSMVQNLLLIEAEERLHACGWTGANPQKLCFGLIAQGSIVNCANYVANPDLVIINVATQLDGWIAESAPSSWTSVF
jgi:hypothetical protein